MSNHPSIPAIVCVPDAIPPEDRPAHAALTRHLFGEVATGKRVLTGGYAFRFPTSTWGELSRFVENERRCCPFLTFRLEVGNDDAVWLQMVGPEGAREVLVASLPELEEIDVSD